MKKIRILKNESVGSNNFGDIYRECKDDYNQIIRKIINAGSFNAHLDSVRLLQKQIYETERTMGGRF